MDSNSSSGNHGNLNKATSDDSSTQLHRAFDQASDKVKPALSSLATGAQDGIDKLGDTIDKVSSSIGDVSNTLGERTKQLGASYKQFADSGRECVRGSPVVSVLAALAAGYGIAKFLGARK